MQATLKKFMWVPKRARAKRAQCEKSAVRQERSAKRAQCEKSAVLCKTIEQMFTYYAIAFLQIHTIKSHYIFFHLGNEG